MNRKMNDAPRGVWQKLTNRTTGKETGLTQTNPSTLLRRLGLDRPELRAWALYDLGNSAFVTTVVVAVFPIYFSSVAAADLTPAMATTRFATATAVAVAVAAVLAPFLGNLADVAAMKKKLLAAFLVLGAGATGGMVFIQRATGCSLPGFSWPAMSASPARSFSTTRCTFGSPRRSVPSQDLASSEAMKNKPCTLPVICTLLLCHESVTGREPGPRVATHGYCLPLLRSPMEPVRSTGRDIFKS